MYFSFFIADEAQTLLQQAFNVGVVSSIDTSSYINDTLQLLNLETVLSSASSWLVSSSFFLCEQIMGCTQICLCLKNCLHLNKRGGSCLQNYFCCSQQRMHLKLRTTSWKWAYKTLWFTDVTLHLQFWWSLCIHVTWMTEIWSICELKKKK